MIKVVYCLSRKEDLTREQFQQYWRGQHAEKVKERAEAIGMKRYVQSHSYDTPMNAGMASERGGLDGYDGIMEGWWDSEGQAMAALTTPKGMQAMAELLDDEKRFIDHSRSRIFVTREHVIY
jgi:EthD domain